MSPDGLAELYRSSLRDHLAGSGEDALHQAYQLSRSALGEGLGVVDLVLLHHDVLADLMRENPHGRVLPDVSIAAAFLAECLSPFEMMLRGYREANDQLSASNTDLTSANAAVATAHEALKAEVAEREAISHELVEANRLASLGALVAGIAHELNTPIGNALMVSSSFTEAVRELQAELASGAVRRSSIDRFLRTSEEAGRLLDSNLNRASDQIRSFKQIAVDQTSDQRRTFDLKRTIEDAAHSCTPMARQAGVRIETDVDVDVAMDGYPGALSQVIVNLIENAVNHGFPDVPGGDVRIEGRRVSKTVVRIAVSDNGVGIPEALTGKVFGAFFTMGAERGGTGLGLHIVKTIANGALGGTVSLVANVGGGARFVFVLPVEAPHPHGAGPELAEAQPPTDHHRESK